MPDGDSFLPRILSVFYAVFDVRQGPKIVYQVPEGLISTTSTGPSSNIGGFSVPPTPSVETSPSVPPVIPAAFPNGLDGLPSRNSSASLASPTDYYRPGARQMTSRKRSVSAQRTLFNFNDISMFVIPHPALCGRLVTCSTIRHRIIGFPVELNSGAYRRNYFRFNLCFVFDRTADLSCYEPVVRKVSRVLKACEEESSFLSSEKTSQTIHAILEQLYEDLNSYSETSIPIDQFNSIELKIFPFYPNPPVVRDWQVPLALVNLPKRFEENWDLTVLKVSKFVNGVNHVSRIAHLADCDISLTREAIQHLLYYQVIMMIDIFQYSNMYTLCKSVQWLADESHVKEECGPYVTKPTGKIIPDWPKLLHLYSRLKPGRTVYEWMQTYEVEALGIDVRRFISFGVIKGFLRRVHRYPVYIASDSADTMPTQAQLPENGAEIINENLGRRRGQSLSYPNLRSAPHTTVSMQEYSLAQSNVQNGKPVSFPTLGVDKENDTLHAMHSATTSATNRTRRTSAAEQVLEQLQSRDMQKSIANTHSSPRPSWITFQHDNTVEVTPHPSSNPTTVATASASAVITAAGRSESRRHSLISSAVVPSAPVISKTTITSARPARPSRSPSAPHIKQSTSGQIPHLTVPPGLKALLDGEHHTDELSVRFEAGWPLLEQWLRMIGGADNTDDYGRVVIIYK
ncbi:hypothetical protein D9613_002714 [Agrocybe pediades]|uniref:NPR2-domain-containing protein n=1 Tax=Agrocybe pediades TaxID=84607 RepID=A0A8H4QS66_9AGAR|nr:hypothetical protein D9613_002714 [Agrocybe pediades]